MMMMMIIKKKNTNSDANNDKYSCKRQLRGYHLPKHKVDYLEQTLTKIPVQHRMSKHVETLHESPLLMIHAKIERWNRWTSFAKQHCWQHISHNLKTTSLMFFWFLRTTKQLWQIEAWTLILAKEANAVILRGVICVNQCLGRWCIPKKPPHECRNWGFTAENCPELSMPASNAHPPNYPHNFKENMIHPTNPPSTIAPWFSSDVMGFWWIGTPTSLWLPFSALSNVTFYVCVPFICQIFVWHVFIDHWRSSKVRIFFVLNLKS